MVTMSNQKQWWAPVWTGLVMDPEGIHCRRMKNAVWLWLYCVLNANRSTGVLFKKIDTIVADMGVPQRTVTRWITVLRNQCYIDTRTTGRYLVIHIQKWRSRDESDQALLVRHKWPTSYAKSGVAEELPKPRIPASLSDKARLSTFSNDRELTREILKIDIDRTFISENGNDLSPKEALLADDLATALEDQRALPFYRSVAKRLPERVLRRLLGEVKEIPERKITKTRGALFNFLVRQYLEQRDG